MARLRQCLTGNALEAIRSLGFTTPEYEEAKEIKIKLWSRTPTTASLHGSTRTDAIKQKSRYSCSAEVSTPCVVKLRVEEKDREQGDETLHSLMVKKLPHCQLENYSHCLGECAREKKLSETGSKMRSDFKLKRQK